MSNDFEARARAAGEALRRPPSDGGVDAVRRLRRRRQVTRGALAGAATVLVVAVGVVAFGDNDDRRLAPANPTIDRTIPPDLTTESTAPVTTPPGTNPGTNPGTTVPCPTGRDSRAKGTPIDQAVSMSGMVGADIRTGEHACFERVVIELSGPGDVPGWSAAYVDDPQRLGESDEFVDIAGNATLVFRMGAWMTDFSGGTGYNGPTQITPTNVAGIVELRLIENFEGITIWAIGLDAERPFTVTVLDGPPRFVIDFSKATPE